MNLLIIGSGGREHALAWKISKSDKLSKLYISPGNSGTATIGENVDLNIEDPNVIIEFCKEKEVDLVVIGPEQPLANGVVNSLTSAHIRCFGPSKEAAQLESSKVFAKEFMIRHNIPTAKYRKFNNFADAYSYCEYLYYPYVIKVSGLAAGKGVILPNSILETQEALKSVFIENKFGIAGNEVIIEEKLYGQEISLMAFCDGINILPMLPVQDYKRLYDNDKGPNTGGMGAYAPVPMFISDYLDEALEKIIKPTISGIRLEGIPYVGVLYCGLIVTSNGIRVLEFNCRFGDPETQVLMLLLNSDLVNIMEACIDGSLNQVKIHWRNGSAICVIITGQGYPSQSEFGKDVIIAATTDNIMYFHAGLSKNNNKLTTSGGRVLTIACWADNLYTAHKLVYDNIEKVSFDGKYYRKDIAASALITN